MAKKARTMPKKKPVKVSKKKIQQSRKNAIAIMRRRTLLNVALTFALLVIIVSILGFLFMSPTIIIPGDTAPVIEVAAVINGEEITIDQLNQRYDLLPDQLRQLVTRNEVLTQMIDETLMFQQAEKNNLTVSEEELQAHLDAILEENQVTLGELQSSLSNRNLSFEELMGFYENEIMLTKLMEQEVFNQVMISDIDIQDYYYRNVEEYTIPASANVSHILICHELSQRCASNLTMEEALDKTNEVKDMLTEDNFNDIAVQESFEPAAQITRGSLGWISSADPFDRTFLNATFALKAGEVSEPLETVFGFHLIKVFEKREESVLELDVVYDQINQTLTTEQQRTYYYAYIDDIREQANIVNFLE